MNAHHRISKNYSSLMISLAYDVLNHPTNMVDAVGTTRFTWDSVNELLSEDGPWANDTVSYTFNNRLRTGLSLLQPSASAWAQTYGYDVTRRMTNTASPAGAFGYAYDATRQLQVARLSLPNGAYITNTYDNVARELSTILKNSGNAVLDSQNYGYNAASQRTAETNTAGDFRNYTYDNIGEVKTAIGKEAGGVTNRWQEQLGYAYDAAGNLNTRTNNALIQSFGVNNLNELTMTTNAGTLTVAGTTTSVATNVTVNTSNAVLYADATFASTNQPWVSGNNTFTAIAKDVYGRKDTNSITANIQLTNSYIYDLNGNLLSDGIRGFDYDDENELIRVTMTNSWKSEFIYDGKMRRRILKEFTWNGSAWTQTNEVHYVYDGNVVIQERDRNNLPLVTYTRGNDLSGTLQGAGGIGGLLARSDNSQMILGSASAHAYYHADSNGNVTMLINNLQLIVAKYLYDSFGNTLSLSGPLASANTYRFSSKEWNENAGIYYYGRRFYDPNLQRWLNRDPIQEAGGLNLYSFIHNNPISSIDWIGLCTVGEITFDGNGWTITAANGFGGDEGDGYVDFSGLKVNWEANVKVVCCCSPLQTKNGTRVQNATYNGDVWFWKAGGMPLEFPTPTSFFAALGELAAQAIDSNLPRPAGMDSQNQTQIKTWLQGVEPHNPTDGSWKGGKSPCE
jgi:RHS repeat-associated protein